MSLVGHTHPYLETIALGTHTRYQDLATELESVQGGQSTLKKQQQSVILS